MNVINHLSTQSGFSTLEMILAMTIMILTLVIVITVTFGNQSISSDSQTDAEGLEKAQELLEGAQADARKDFKMVNPTPQLQFDSEVPPLCPIGFIRDKDGAGKPDIYCKRIDVVQQDSLTKRITATVKWKGDHNRPQTAKLTTLVTDFNNVSGGDTCSSILSQVDGIGNIIHSDWTNPQKTNILFGQLVSDSYTPYAITDIDTYGGKLYATINNNSSYSVGPKIPTTAADSNENAGTLAWSNPDSAKTSDGVSASAVFSGSGMVVTDYLKVTNFGFTSIPKGSTILGIEVTIKKNYSGGSVGNILDSRVSIIKPDGTIGVANKASGSNWSNTAVISTYGGASDLWGETVWQPSAINNNPNFGVVIAATGSSALTDRTANIDSIQIKVTYIKQFYIFDISSNPTSPTFVAGLGSNANIPTGFNAVATNGRYAYVATNSAPSVGQLQIIDTNATSTIPMIVSTYKIPGTCASGGYGKAISYHDGYVYLGLTKVDSASTFGEFNIIDVHDPNNPQPRGTYKIGNDINDIKIKGKYAYVATPNNNELTVLDISNPYTPTLKGVYDAPDNVGNGKSIALVGDTLYLGRTVTASNPEFYILNNIDPGNLQANNATSTWPYTKEISSSVNGLVVRDYLSFLLTNKQSSNPGQLQFLKFDPAAAPAITQYATPINLPDSGGTNANTGSGVALDCESNYLYAASADGYPKSYITVITGQ